MAGYHHPSTHTPTTPPRILLSLPESTQVNKYVLVNCWRVILYILHCIYFIYCDTPPTQHHSFCRNLRPLLRLNTKRITGLLSFYFQSLVEGLKIKSSKSSSLLTDISECPETEAVANTLWLVTNSKSCPNCK